MELGTVVSDCRTEKLYYHLDCSEMLDSLNSQSHLFFISLSPRVGKYICNLLYSLSLILIAGKLQEEKAKHHILTTWKIF